MLTDRGLRRGELLLEHLDDKWRQAFRRLVEEQDLGVHHHRAGDGKHVLLAAAQRARPLVSPVRRALTGAAPVSCSASMRGGCTRIRLRLSPRCHQRFDGWLRRERISSGKSANYLSTQNPCASTPSAVLNLLRKNGADRRLGMLRSYALHTEAKRCTGRNPDATARRSKSAQGGRPGPSCTRVAPRERGGTSSRVVNSATSTSKAFARACSVCREVTAVPA